MYADIQRIKNARLAYTNGITEAILWDPITFSGSLQNTSVKYQIDIINDVTRYNTTECTYSDSRAGTIEFPYNYSSQSHLQCETFTFRIKPIISNDSTGGTTEVSQGMKLSQLHIACISDHAGCTQCIIIIAIMHYQNNYILHRSSSY